MKARLIIHKVKKKDFHSSVPIILAQKKIVYHDNLYICFEN